MEPVCFERLGNVVARRASRVVCGCGLCPGIRQQLHDAMTLYKEHKSGVFSALVGFIGRVVGFYALTVGLDMLAQEMQANPDALRLVPECAAGCVKAVRIGCQLVFGVLVAIF